ncbi:MAG: hypothetical protein ACPGYL_14660, partial [Rhodospirillaceae bacterium]
MRPFLRHTSGMLLSAALLGTVSPLALMAVPDGISPVALAPMAQAQSTGFGDSSRPAILRPGSNGTLTLEVGEG